MKYLKLYEEYEPFSDKMTFKEYLKTCTKKGIQLMQCSGIDFGEGNLDGIENSDLASSLKIFYCCTNNLKSLKGIENIITLTELFCYDNHLESIKEVENLKNLETLMCYDNNIKSIDENIIENLPRLKKFWCLNNPLEYPLSEKIGNRFELKYLYNEITLKKFKSYYYQRKFLTEHPDKATDLKHIGFNEKIKIEFPALISGVEWGFFDLEGTK